VPQVGFKLEVLSHCDCNLVAVSTDSVLTLAILPHAEAVSAFRKFVSYVCWCLIVTEVRCIRGGALVVWRT